MKRFTVISRSGVVGIFFCLSGICMFALFMYFISDVRSNDDEYSRMFRGFEGGKCKSCHPAIWREWEKSMHAQAWVDEIYQAAAKTVKDRQRSCDPCHAPEPILVTGIGKMPKLRNDQRDSGVSCLVCHLDENGAMHGPQASAETNFHTNVTDPIYTSPTKLCATCHGQPSVPEHDQVSSFLESRYAEEKKSCSTCHMPIVNRMQSTASYESTKGRKHTWRGSRSVAQLKGAATLKIEFEGQKATVILQNKTGHLLPGGTLRTIIFDVMSVSTEGTQQERKQVLISDKAANRLKPDEKRTYVLDVKGGHRLTARLRYQLTPDTPEDKWVLMAEVSKVIE